MFTTRAKSRADIPGGPAGPRIGRNPKLARRPRLQVERLEARDVPAALFASSFFDGAVYQFDSNTGALQGTLVAPNSGGLLSGPAGLALGPDNNLYLSSQNNNAILQYNRTTNALSTFIPSTVLQPIAATSGNAVFAPAGLTFGPDGDLYVGLNGGQSSSGGGQVIRFDVTATNGTLAYGGTFAVTASNLLQPAGLTFGTAPGDTNSLYVSGLGITLVGGSPIAAGTVSKVTNAPTAPTTSTFVPPNSDGLTFASGLTWGPDGKLYAVDLGATSNVGRILRYNTDGSFDAVFTQANGAGQGNLMFQFPSDAKFNDQGQLLTANLGPAYPPNLQGSINLYGVDGVFAQTLVSSAQFPNTGAGTSGISPSQIVLAPTPLVTAVSPTQGAASGGATVTITGTNLASATAVTFGNAIVTNFLSNTATQIAVLAPAGTGTVDVRVTTANGTSAATAADRFTHVPAPTVALASTAPDPTGSSLIPVIVTFSSAVTGFTAGDVVATNGTITGFTGSGAAYSFQVLASDQGVVTVNVPANVAQDVVGNGNQAATPLSRTFSAALPPTAAGAESTVGAFDPAAGVWYLRFSNSPGAPDVAPFAYGAPGWTPVIGDWDGNGTVTVGVVDTSTMTWYLRNSNTPGAPDYAPFQYGAPGWVPVVGDWGGTGHTGIGAFDPGTATFYLRGEVGPGLPNVASVHYGGSGWTPVVGDWDGDGTVTVGVVNPLTGTWYLRNSNTPGAPDLASFAYGGPNWEAVAGDWNGDGRTTVGVVNPATGVWYLRNANSPGAPDFTPFAYGAPSWVPVAGAFNPDARPLKAAGGAAEAADDAFPLTQDVARGVLAAALARLQQNGVSSQLTAQLGSVQVEVGVLGGGLLARAIPQAGRFTLDAQAAGHGWFVDPTPLQDEEFASGEALSGGPAAGRMDLLTAVLQELAVVGGLEGDTFTAALAAGSRNLDALTSAFVQASRQ